MIPVIISFFVTRIWGCKSLPFTPFRNNIVDVGTDISDQLQSVAHCSDCKVFLN